MSIQSVPASLTPLTIAGFLVGRRSAIQAVASSPSALWLGAIFVLAAGLAREYDRHDLLAQPWRLLIPFAASVAIAFVQFCLYWSVRKNPESALTFGQACRAFLACFWMTAPIALLYAIPYERFLEPADALRANYQTLLFISLWRGLIICRVVQVLGKIRFFTAFIVGLTLGDIIVQMALFVMPVPVFNPMAGLAQTPAVQEFSEIALITRFLGIPALLLLVPISLTLLGKGRATWLPLAQPSRVSPTTWGLAAIPIVALAALLPIAQPPVRLAHRADSLLREGRLAEAVALLAAHDEARFPPGWRPLPIHGMPIRQPPLLDVAMHTIPLPVDAWVRKHYFGEVTRLYLNRVFHYWARDEDWLSLEDFLRALPDEERIVLENEHREQIDHMRTALELSPPASRPATPGSTSAPSTTRAIEQP